MDATDNNPPNIKPVQPNMLKNENPALLSVVLSNVSVLLGKYGWFILLGIIITISLWNKVEPYWWKWRKERKEEYEEANIDAETLAKTQEALQRSRRNMQEKNDAKAAEFAEKVKEIDEKRRQEKIADWERHQQGRGYRSKNPKPDDGQKGQENKSKPKKTGRVRNSDFNPLTGSSSGTSYRPASRRNTGGG